MRRFPKNLWGSSREARWCALLAGGTSTDPIEEVSSTSVLFAIGAEFAGEVDSGARAAPSLPIQRLSVERKADIAMDEPDARRKIKRPQVLLSADQTPAEIRRALEGLGFRNDRMTLLAIDREARDYLVDALVARHGKSG